MKTLPKLSELKASDKIRMAAELDGYKIEERWQLSEVTYLIAIRGRLKVRLSDFTYSTSYDSVFSLIQKQPAWVADAVWCDAFITENGLKKLKTPPQLLDALLVATGKATL